MYNKHNCQSSIRRVKCLDNGLVKVKIIVAGQHAFKWSVTVIKETSKQSLIFSRSKGALKEYQRLITQFRQLGDCNLCMR